MAVPIRNEPFAIKSLRTQVPVAGLLYCDTLNNDHDQAGTQLRRKQVKWFHEPCTVLGAGAARYGTDHRNSVGEIGIRAALFFADGRSGDQAGLCMPGEEYAYLRVIQCPSPAVEVAHVFVHA